MGDNLLCAWQTERLGPGLAIRFSFASSCTDSRSRECNVLCVLHEQRVIQ